MTELSSLGSEAEFRNRAAIWRTTWAARSSSKWNRRASERSARSARACPFRSPMTSTSMRITRTTPMIAAVP